MTPEDWSAGLPVLPRPLLMGVVNVTPDSFSDGGRFDDHRGGGRPRRSTCATRAPTCSTSAASRPAPAPPAHWSPRSSTGWSR